MQVARLRFALLLAQGETSIPSVVVSQVSLGRR